MSNVLYLMSKGHPYMSHTIMHYNTSVLYKIHDTITPLLLKKTLVGTNIVATIITSIKIVS